MLRLTTIPGVNPCFIASLCAAEGAFIATLRTHYTRNGTAESFAPKFSKSPTKTYSRNARAGGGASGGDAATGATGAPTGGLAQQERALWEEREEELVDAQVGKILGVATPIGC